MDIDIIKTYPCNEEGFVYVDALFGDEVRRLILPEKPEDAQDKLTAYAAENSKPVEATEAAKTPLDILINEEKAAAVEARLAEEAKPETPKPIDPVAETPLEVTEETEVSAEEAN